MAVQPATYYQSPTGKHAVYYFTSWCVYARNYFVKDLPIDKITDIAYAFFNIDATGKVFSGDSWADMENPFIGKGVPPENTWSSPPTDLGNFGQFYKLIKQGKKFNLSLSVGGWSWSKYFSSAVSTDQTRNNIVSSLTSIFQKYPGLFNGVSFDWEYLSDDGVNYGLEGNEANKNDVVNFIELLKLCKTKLPGFRFSLCLGAAPEKTHLPLETLHTYLDELHLMCYDFSSGAWGEKITAHHCNPRKSSFGKWSAEQAADYYLSRKVPGEKLFIGGAEYSRGFSGTDGFGKPATGNSPDFQFSEEPGIVPYHMLPMPGATEYVDPECKGAYSYDPIKKICNTYDNVDSIKEKCKIVFEKGLKGIIFWESAGDVKDYNSPRSLMRTVAENLTHTTTSGPPKPTPVPTPVPIPTPTPTPDTKTYSCEYCTVCTKKQNTACKARVQEPKPTPAPSPSPAPSPGNWVLNIPFKKGDIVSYNGKRYVCLMSHTSINAWAPDLARALWQQIV